MVQRKRPRIWGRGRGGGVGEKGGGRKEKEIQAAKKTSKGGGGPVSNSSPDSEALTDGEKKKVEGQGGSRGGQKSKTKRGKRYSGSKRVHLSNWRGKD